MKINSRVMLKDLCAKPNDSICDKLKKRAKDVNDFFSRKLNQVMFGQVFFIKYFFYNLYFYFFTLIMLSEINLY